MGVLLAMVWAIVLVVNSYDYQAKVLPDGKFLNAKEVADYVRTLAPGDLYGAHEIVPLVALLADRKIFNDYIALGSQAYDAGVASKEKVSQEVADKGTYLISRITDLPQYGIVDSGYQNYFQKEVFEKYCRRKKEFPSISREQDSLIMIYECRR